MAAAGTVYTALSFKCSRCDASFADLTRCKQHCNHPANCCNRGKAREYFARVISVEVLFRESDREIGGSRVRQYSDRDGQPKDDFGVAQQLDTLSTPGIQTYLRTYGHI